MASLTHDELVRFFFALAVLLATARLLGEIAVRVRQPTVMGEILAGILLGPTVLGRLAPGVSTWLFPSTGGFPAAFEAFTTVAIVLFLLTAGFEVDLSTVWRQGRSALRVGLTGMLIPFSIGFVLARAVPQLVGAEGDTNPLVFALFFGTALSITALPVVIKILIDLNIFRSDVGMIIVSSAILLDLVGWNLFAVVLSLSGAAGAQMSVGTTVTLTILFASIMLTFGRMAFHRVLPWLQAHATYPGGVLGFALAGALACAAFTEWIGIHAIFGAFIFGIALGDSVHLRAQTRTMLENFVGFIFAPIFFASIGLKVDFVASFDPVLTLVVLAVGTIGMVGGGTIGARWSGLAPRESLAVGVAMNARGAMEIILGLLALRHGIIGEHLFVALVIIALVTSMTSGTLMQSILRLKRRVRFHDYLTSKTFATSLDSSDREEAIAQLCRLAGLAANLNVDDLTRRVLDREQTASTGLPGGIAVPHARVPGLRSPVVAVGRAQPGIDFDASDGKPATLIFLIVTPENDHQSQLEILADIAATFANAALVERMARAAGYTEFLAVIKREVPG
ncbi:MAG: cation:proton antiporter [Deltaproteobacteria bacterium]|nr:cation:proton antiporter [Deltaproteobacteria bacterium]